MSLRDEYSEVPDDLHDAEGLTPEAARGACEDYRRMTPEERDAADDFVRGGGPERLRQLALHVADGTPTAADLESWASVADDIARDVLRASSKWTGPRIVALTLAVCALLWWLS